MGSWVSAIVPGGIFNFSRHEREAEREPEAIEGTNEKVRSLDIRLIIFPIADSLNAESVGSINSATSAISALRFGRRRRSPFLVRRYRRGGERAENPQRSRKRFLPLLLHYHFCNKWRRASAACGRFHDRATAVCSANFRHN